MKWNNQPDAEKLMKSDCFLKKCRYRGEIKKSNFLVTDGYYSGYDFACNRPSGMTIMTDYKGWICGDFKEEDE